MLYLIIFSLWLPGLLISYIIINCYYYNNRFNFSSFKQYFNLRNLKVLFISIGFSVRCLILLILDVTMLYYKPKFPILHSYKYAKHLNYLLSYDKQHLNPRALRASVPWTCFAIGPLLYFVDDKKDIYHWKPEGSVLCKALYKNGFEYDKTTRLIVPSAYKINSNSGIYKQIENFKDSQNIYVRISKYYAERLSYFKMCCTKTLDIQKELFLVKNFPNTPVRGIIDTQAMKNELTLMNKYTTDESYTYGFINMLLTHYFKAHDGYVVSPQSKQAAGQPDFIIKKDGDVVAVVESKALDAKSYPFTHLYAQPTEYANTNKSFTSVFVIVNKGDYLSFGVMLKTFIVWINLKWNLFYLMDILVCKYIRI